MRDRFLPLRLGVKPRDGDDGEEAAALVAWTPQDEAGADGTVPTVRVDLAACARAGHSDYVWGIVGGRVPAIMMIF